MRFYYFLRNKLIILSAVIFYPILRFWFGRREAMWDGEVRRARGEFRILVIPQLTRIGDLVCAMPVFRAIKQRYPRSFLAVMMTGKIAPLVKNNPYIDEIVQYSTKDLMGVIKSVQARYFDWSFALAPSSLVGAIMAWGLVPRRAKIVRAGKPWGEAVTDGLATHPFLYKHGDYLPGEYLKMLKFIGIDNVNTEKEVFVTQEGEKKAEAFLPPDNKPLVGISITAGNKIKEWGDEKFIELAKRILDKYKNAKIILIGSKNDKSRIEAVEGALPSGVALSATDFTLEELPSLIKRLDLYIGVDTGPIYIAEALGTPLVDIIGPVDPSEQPPCNAPKSVCVMPEGDIKPSSFVLKRPGKNHRAALEATSVDSVMEAVATFLERLNEVSR